MKRQCTSRSLFAHKGFSLIELMIAMVLGLVLSLGISELFISNQQASTVTRNLSNMQENLRTGDFFLTDAIRMAGQWSGIERASLITGSLSFTGLGNCNSSWVRNFAEGLRGFNGNISAGAISGLPSGCLKNYLPNTDIIVVRYADASNMVADGDLNTSDNRAFIRAELDQNRGFVGRLFQPSSGVPATKKLTTLNMPLRADMYYVKSCSEESPAGVCTNNIPSLARITLSNLTVADQVLVEGVENLQFEFGVDTNRNRSPNVYRAANQVNNWDRVVSARFSLLVRANQLDISHSDTDTYNLSRDTSSFQPDNNSTQFYRKLIQQTVELKNRRRSA